MLCDDSDAVGTNGMEWQGTQAKPGNRLVTNKATAWT